jgi:hypothetical protein
VSAGERAAEPGPNGAAAPGDVESAARTPRWAVVAIWLAAFGGLAAVTLFGRAIVQTRYGFGIHESIPTVLRRFDAALAGTGWGDGVRVALWATGALALAAAAVYLWLALTPPDADS